MSDPEPDEGGEHEEGAGQGSVGGGGGVDPAELRQAIREVLAEMGAGPGGTGGSGEGAGGEGASGGDGTPAAGGRLIDQEHHWEQIVRSELEKVRTKEDVESLKEEVRKIVERPPRKYRKITTRIWGGADE